MRREGGGRPKLIDLDPDLLTDLDDLVEPRRPGRPDVAAALDAEVDPASAKALGDMGHQVSSWAVGQLLPEMGYSLQATAKTVEGAQHPDRNAQFEYINRLTAGASR